MKVKIKVKVTCDQCKVWPNRGSNNSSSHSNSNSSNSSNTLAGATTVAAAATAETPLAAAAAAASSAAAAATEVAKSGGWVIAICIDFTDFTVFTDFYTSCRHIPVACVLKMLKRFWTKKHKNFALVQVYQPNLKNHS